MINLARHLPDDPVSRRGIIDSVTSICRAELAAAGIEVCPRIVPGEVPSRIEGHLHGWWFIRAWYYWMASTDSLPIPMDDAEKLYVAHGKDVRVDGHCGCPSPREWWGGKGTASAYHVDTQEGLNALADAIRAVKDRVTSS